MHALIISLILTVGPALAEEPLPQPVEPAAGRLLLNSAVLGAGMALVGAGAYNLTQAGEAYDDYLVADDQGASDALLSEQVRPRQVAGIAELGLGAAALGVGTILWIRTDGVQVGGGPGQLIVRLRF
jgi:hypothetical protein